MYDRMNDRHFTFSLSRVTDQEITLASCFVRIVLLFITLSALY